MVDIFQCQGGVIQTIGDSVFGKIGVVFFAGEAFFLGGRNDATIHNQSSGAVVIQSGNAQDIHQRPLSRKSCK